MARRAVKTKEVEALKLDLGAGPHKKEGFLGVDSRKFPGIDIVHNLLKPWPWDADSVEEIHMSHTLEHFTGKERVFVMNEMYRVMQKGAKATIICPHWSSARAYGDYDHKWPPVGEFWIMYLSKKWRDENAPHDDIKWDKDGYSCDFKATCGFALHPEVANKAQERQMFSMTFYKEACQDIVMTLEKV